MKSVIELQEKLMTNQNELIKVKEQMQEIDKKVKQVSALEGKRDLDQEFTYRSGIRDLNALAKEWDQLKVQEKEIEDKLAELEASPPR